MSIQLDEIVGRVNNGVPVNNKFYDSFTQFARPNNTISYTADDVIGTSPAGVLEFKNVGEVGKKIIITQSTLEIWQNTMPDTIGPFRMHIFTESPSAISDNEPFTLVANDRRKHAGWIDFPTPSKLGDTLKSQTVGALLSLTLLSASIFAQLTTKVVFTPSANTVNYINLGIVGV